jgi:hypothetical protein
MQHHQQLQKASNFKLFGFILFVYCLFVKLLALKATGVGYSTHLTGWLHNLKHVNATTLKHAITQATPHATAKSFEL